MIKGPSTAPEKNCRRKEMAHTVLSDIGRLFCVSATNLSPLSIFMLHPVNHEAYLESVSLDPFLLGGML